MSHPDEYNSNQWWHAIVPGLTAEDAVRLIRLVAQEAPELLESPETPLENLSDPRSWFPCFLNREMAVTVREGLSLLEQQPGADSLIESIDSWLSEASAYATYGKNTEIIAGIRWHLHIPRMTAEDALKILEIVRTYYPELMHIPGQQPADVVDPRNWMVFIGDRDTVELMRAGLSKIEPTAIANKLARQFDEWLEGNATK